MSDFTADPGRVKSDYPTGTERPRALQLQPDNIPAYLTQQNRWVVWQYLEQVDLDTGEVTWDKPPLRARDLGAASTTDPRTWSSFSDALDAYRRHELDGVGIVIPPAAAGEADRLVGVDLDHCRNPVTGELNDFARGVVGELDTYAEASPSGEGLRAFLLGRLPPGGRKKPQLEVYDHARYVTVTGHKLPGARSTVELRTEQIAAVHARVWPAAANGTANGAPHPAYPPPGNGLSDEEVLALANQSSIGEKFKALWEGKVPEGKTKSEADLALCNYLAFFCGPDVERIADLFARSNLFRSKWQRADYRARTIAKALEGRTDYYSPPGTAAGHIKMNGSAPGAAPPEPEPWPPLIPFGRPGDVPAFPTDLLPPWMRNWVEAESVATQTPPDLAAGLALAFAGAGLARKVKVRVRDSWTEPANIFFVAALPPGDRKSAVFDDAKAPVRKYELEEQARMAPVIAKAESKHRVLEKKVQHLELKLAKADDAGDAAKTQDDLNKAAIELAEHVVPEKPEMICDDITPEDLSKLIAKQGGRMLQASDEGTAFEIAGGRYSEKPRFEVYLHGHSGGAIRTGRVTREGDAADNIALSCALAVQPSVVAGLAENATMKARGFLARFWYSIPVTRVGHRQIAPVGMTGPIREAYERCMLALWRFKTEAPDTEVEFSDGADQLLRAFETWLEPQLAPGEPLASLGGWASKLAGAIARLALILHMSSTVAVEQPWNEPITAEAVETAIKIGRDYLLPHAQAAFALLGADERQQDARRVVAWLTAPNCESVKAQGGVRTISRAAIHRGVFGGSRTVEEVSTVCRLLCDHGYLRPAGPSWRKDVHLYEINPEVWDDGKKSS